MAVWLSDHRAMFLHVPKTGGSWINTALRNCGVKVEEARRNSPHHGRHALKDQFGEYKVKYWFTFVRHPIKWYESCWLHFQDKSLTDRWTPLKYVAEFARRPFEEFVMLCVKHEPAFVTRMCEWYVGPKGGGVMDFVGRTERLAKDLVLVLDMLEANFDGDALIRTETVNVSLGERPEWLESLSYKVLELEAPLLERFYADGV